MFPSFGNLLSRSLQLYKKKFSVTIPLAGLMAVGQFLFAPKNEFLKTFIPHHSLFSLVYTFTVGTLLSASLIYAIQEDKISSMECLRNGIKKFFGFLWVTVLSGIVILGIPLAISLFTIISVIFLLHSFHFAQSTQRVMELFAFFLVLVISFFVIYTRFLFSIFVFMKEGIKGSKALMKSSDLVTGNWWNVSWRFLVILFSIIAVRILFSYFAKRFGVPTLELLQYVLYGLLTPFYLSFLYLLYEDAKAFKEENSKGRVG